MLSRFILSVAAFFLAYASSLAAEDLVAIELGPTSFSVPDSWIDPGWRDAAQVTPTDSILLSVPPGPLPSFDDPIDATGIETISILLRHDVGQQGQHVAFMAMAGAKEIGIASPTDAAEAFNGLTFDALYGGRIATSGKGATVALYLVGLVPHNDQSIVVGAKIESRPDSQTRRQYIIASMLRSNDADFEVVIALTASRVLQSDDLVWVDVASKILNSQIDF